MSQTQRQHAQLAVIAAKKRARTHCPNGHPFDGFRANGNGLTCRTCTTCRREREHKHGGVKNVTRSHIERVLDALRDGRTLNNIYGLKGGGRCRSYIGGKIIDCRSLRKFREKNPKLDSLIEKLASANRYRAMHRHADRRVVAAPAIIRNDGADAFAAIMAATAHLAEYQRDDVRSAMFVAVAEGRLHPRDAGTRLREFVSAENRMFSKYVPVIGGVMGSLDQPAYRDSPIPLVETISRGLWQ